MLTWGCPSDVKGLAIGTCWHGHLGASGNLQSARAPALSARAFEDEEEAAPSYFDQADPYFEPFREEGEGVWSLPAEDEVGVEGGLERRGTVACPAPGNSTGEPTTPTTERQRIEFFSWPEAQAGDTWTYSWRSYQSTNTKVSSSFFHSWQIIRRDGCTSNPVITSDLHKTSQGSRFGVTDYNPKRRCATTGKCPSIALSSIVGKTIQHSITVRWGLNGKFSYKAVDVAKPKTVLISYSATGDMGGRGSVKWGNYRQVSKGNSAVDTYVGDYSAVQVA